MQKKRFKKWISIGMTLCIIGTFTPVLKPVNSYAKTEKNSVESSFVQPGKKDMETGGEITPMTEYLNTITPAAIAMQVSTPSALKAPAIYGSINIEGKTAVNLSENQSGTGWSWDAVSATLALDSQYPGNSIKIYCNSTDTINLEYSGDTIIRDTIAPLYCSGNLRINGIGGTLFVDYYGSGTDCAIEVLNVLDVIGGKVSATSSGNSGEYIYSAVIFAFKGIAITGDASVIGIATGENSYGLATDSVSGNGVYISTDSYNSFTGTGTKAAVGTLNGSKFHLEKGVVALNSTTNRLLEGEKIITGGRLYYNEVLQEWYTVGTAEELKAVLEKEDEQIFMVNADIELKELIEVNGNHTVIIPEGVKIVITEGGIDTTDQNISILGKGELISSRITGHALYGLGTLNLEGVTVRLQNTERDGVAVKVINIGSNSSIILDSASGKELMKLSKDDYCTIEKTGTIQINNFLDTGLYLNGGTIQMNGGTVSLQAGNGEKRAIHVGVDSILNIYDGIIEGVNESRIYLEKDSSMINAANLFMDQGHLLTENTTVLVGDELGTPTSSGLSAGSYIWNSDTSIFEKEKMKGEIRILTHPENIAATEGKISGSISVDAVTDKGQQISYQWYLRTGEGESAGSGQLIAGATDRTFSLPLSLQEGSYMYYCLLRAEGCDDIASRDSVVTVNAPDKSEEPGDDNDSGDSNYDESVTTHEEDSVAIRKPVIVTYQVKPAVNKNQKATAVITAEQLQTVIEDAKKSADNKGVTDNIEVALKVGIGVKGKSLAIKFEREAWNLLIDNKVSKLDISTSLINVTFDNAAIQKVKQQSLGDITFAYTPVTKLPAVSQKSDNREVYDITVSYLKKGVTKKITDFGNGKLTIAIAYQVREKENPNAVTALLVDKQNTVELQNSIYHNGYLTFTSSKLSIYGVGYNTVKTDFSDTKNHWAADSIAYVVSRGFLSKTSNTTFSPEKPITRGEFMSAIGKLSGIKAETMKTSSFGDVKATDPVLPYIEWAVKNGIIKSISSKVFQPEGELTREEMAVIIRKYAEVTKETLPAVRQERLFGDTSLISQEAKKAVSDLQKAGILGEKDRNLFDPLGSLTRAEAAHLLYQYIKITIDENNASGWNQNSSGKWQYFDTNGKLIVNSTIDGYVVGADGVRADK